MDRGARASALIRLLVTRSKGHSWRAPEQILAETISLEPFLERLL